MEQDVDRETRGGTLVNVGIQSKDSKRIGREGFTPEKGREL